MLRRNRAALDELVSLLVEQEDAKGAEVTAIIERLGDSADLARRAEAKEAAFL